MKHIVLIPFFLFLFAGWARIHAQIVSASLAEIRSFETKIDSMERVIVDSVQGLTPKGYLRQKRILVITPAVAYTPREAMVVYDRLKIKKRKQQLWHKRTGHRELHWRKKNDLDLKIIRLDGVILRAVVKDEASKTKWVYDSSGYLKMKRPGSLMVWYYLKPKQ